MSLRSCITHKDGHDNVGGHVVLGHGALEILGSQALQLDILVHVVGIIMSHATFRLGLKLIT